MQQFTENQAKLWQLVYNIITSGKKEGATSEDLIKRVSTFLHEEQGYSEQFAPITAQLFMKIMQKKDLNPEFPAPLRENAAYLAKQDYLQLTVLCADHRDLSGRDYRDLVRLIVSFALYARAFPHSSGWIRYDRSTINHLAGIKKRKVSEQESLTKVLHSYYNLNMRVVGSNQPLPCYRLDWLQPLEETADNKQEIIPLGALTPETVASVADNIINGVIITPTDTDKGE